MAINYTTLLGLAQPVPGTEANTWGTVVNDELTALVDSAIAGASTLNVTAGNVTLTTTAGVANQARMAILIATGTPGTTRNIVAPSQSKTYIVVNQADASVVLKGSATTGVAIRAGQAATCVWNGTDFEIAASGDVDGPSSATDNAIARFDLTTGKLIQNSGVTIDDSNNVSGVVQLNATTVDTTNVEVTNLKAKDGTAAGSIANSTGVVTLASSVLTTTDINGGTIDGVTIGGASAGAVSSTNLAYTGTLTGGTGVVNIGSGQVYKDASGNVGIGVTPSAWTTSVKAIQFGSNGSLVNRTGGSGTYLSSNAYFSGDPSNTAANGIYINSTLASSYLQTGGTHVWFTAPSGTAGNAISFTQAMTLDASGNLLVGGTTGGVRLYVKGAGATSSTYSLYVQNSTPTDLFYIRNDGLITTGTAATSPYNNTTGVATNMVVGSDGILYRSTSSLKYKTDVNDATHGLSELLTLRPVTYKGKNDGDKVFGGLIAEEVHEAGLTEFVQYAEDGTPDALAYGNMVSLCIKAIQEMKAIIDAQAERITALEAK